MAVIHLIKCIVFSVRVYHDIAQTETDSALLCVTVTIQNVNGKPAASTWKDEGYEEKITLKSCEVSRVVRLVMA